MTFLNPRSKHQTLRHTNKINIQLWHKYIYFYKKIFRQLKMRFLRRAPLHRLLIYPDAPFLLLDCDIKLSKPRRPKPRRAGRLQRADALDAVAADSAGRRSPAQNQGTKERRRTRYERGKGGARTFITRMPSFADCSESFFFPGHNIQCKRR